MQRNLHLIVFLISSQRKEQCIINHVMLDLNEAKMWAQQVTTRVSIAWTSGFQHGHRQEVLQNKSTIQMYIYIYRF